MRFSALREEVNTGYSVSVFFRDGVAQATFFFLGTEPTSVDYQAMHAENANRSHEDQS